MDDRSETRGEESNDDSLGLDDFQSTSDEPGLSLLDLGAAYAELLNRGATPYDKETNASDPNEPVEATSDLDDDSKSPSDDNCELSPLSILEAMLFVGDAQNRPQTSRQIAALMRGVRPQEVDDMVVELNRHYAAENRPYFVNSVEHGYVMSLQKEFSGLRDAFYGRVKEARLSQNAIDILSVVAYRQPITREELDDIRGKPSGGILSQLVRRQLLRIDRSPENSKQIHFHTTERFLDVFGLESLSELPRSAEETGQVEAP